MKPQGEREDLQNPLSSSPINKPDSSFPPSLKPTGSPTQIPVWSRNEPNKHLCARFFPDQNPLPVRYSHSFSNVHTGYVLSRMGVIEECTGYFTNPTPPSAKKNHKPPYLSRASPTVRPAHPLRPCRLGDRISVNSCIRTFFYCGGGEGERYRSALSFHQNSINKISQTTNLLPRPPLHRSDRFFQQPRHLIPHARFPRLALQSRTRARRRRGAGSLLPDPGGARFRRVRSSAAGCAFGGGAGGGFFGGLGFERGG